MTNPAPPRKASGIENIVAGRQIDRERRALLGGNGRSDGRSSDVANDRLAREADAVLSSSAPPIQIFHVKEIVLGHETDGFDECACPQNTSPAHGIDAAEFLGRWRAAGRRI